MLESLWIENFLTIQHLEMDFEAGFIALTGETGAGKSMLMEGLQLALGARGDVDLIRAHAPYCEVTATFHVPNNSGAFLFAQSQDFGLDDEQWVFTRQLHPNGRSKAYLNGKPCALQMLKALGEHLIHVHGQHAHHALMHPSTARFHVDRFGQHRELLEEVHEAFDDVQKIQKKLASCQSTQDLAQKLAFLQFQRDELLGLNLQEGEFQALSQEHKRLHALQDYLHVGQSLVEGFNGDDHGLKRRIHELQLLIKPVAKHETSMQTIENMLDQVAIEIDEASSEAQQWLNSLVDDPARLEEVELRISQLHQTARKYRVDVGQLNDLLQQWTQEAEAITTILQEQPKLEEAYAQASALYREKAQRLHQARSATIPKLEQGITAYMKQLGLPHGQMHIRIEALTSMERHGSDHLCYEVTTNPGMPPSLLSKVVSGGELSRISLAIELMTAERSCTPTLLFDEVDVGIGGKTASMVGQLLRHLGDRAQVFCVTHQPQVASCAHHHVQIAKQVNDHEVFTHAMFLDSSARIEEIARMLGGDHLGDEAFKHAEVMLMDGSERVL